MKTYYFTYPYGSAEESGMPFSRGWTEVTADSISKACEIFRAAHPNPDGSDILNCCVVYGEETFNQTTMKEKGNFGVFCHERLN